MRQDSPFAYQLVGNLRPARFDLPRLRLSLTLPDLDAVLGGGIPCGAITEIFGGASSGRTTLAQVLISAVTHAGEFAAWIDLPNAFDPNCARAAGVDLERMLWVSPADHLTALRSVEYVLDAGGFRVVVLDLDRPSGARPTVSASAWLRMGRAAACRNAAIVVIAAAHAVGTFAALSLEACAHRRVFAGESGPCPVFEGSTSSLRIQRYKFGPPATTLIELCASTKA